MTEGEEILRRFARGRLVALLVTVLFHVARTLQSVVPPHVFSPLRLECLTLAGHPLPALGRTELLPRKHWVCYWGVQERPKKASMVDWGLTDHFALIADAALAFVCESLHACENRIGIKMRFRDHFRFEAAASPGIVEVGGE
jgi:hypothetical protein